MQKTLPLPGVRVQDRLCYLWIRIQYLEFDVIYLEYWS